MGKSDIRYVLCDTYDEERCPIGCTFWDCNDFIPSEYFLWGIKNDHKSLK